MSTPSIKLTAAQERALTRAAETGGALAPSGNQSAFTQMCLRLSADGLLDGRHPYGITDAGRAALAVLKLARREKAYRRGEAWAMLEVHAEQEAEKAAQADTLRIEPEADGAYIRIFRGDRCLATATRRRMYATGPAWKIATSDGASFGEADTVGGARFKLRRAAAAFEARLAQAPAPAATVPQPVQQQQACAAVAPAPAPEKPEPRPMWRPTGIGGSILTNGLNGRTLAEVNHKAGGGFYASAWVPGTPERQGSSSRELGTFITQAAAEAYALAELTREGGMTGAPPPVCDFEIPTVAGTPFPYVGFRHFFASLKRFGMVRIHVREAPAYAYATGEWVDEAYTAEGRMSYAKSWMRCGPEWRFLAAIGVGAYGNATIVTRDQLLAYRSHQG